MVKLTSNDPTWGDTLEGLFGSVLRGGSLGFSDYIYPDLNRQSQNFAARNPASSMLANIIGAIGSTAKSAPRG